THADTQTFRHPLQASKTESTKIRNNAENQLGPDKAALFDAHLLVLDDPELTQPNEDKIANEKVSAPEALAEVTSQFNTLFE
ncbi:phosphoenolpyruvate-utilizing N-terminal domain-containing protein, partial [Staphylococcus sp. SIMBA_130]